MMSNDIETPRLGGELDPEFGVGGKAEVLIPGHTQHSFNTVVVNNGKVYAGGVAGRDFMIASFSANGQLNESFGSHGVVVKQFMQDANNSCRDIIISSDKKLIVAGAVKTNLQLIGFARISAISGAWDTSFSEGGVVVHNLFSRRENAKVIPAISTVDVAFATQRASGENGSRSVVLPDGKLMCAIQNSATGPSGYSVIARFQKSPDKLDTDFAKGGYAEVRHPDYLDGHTQVMNITVQADLKYAACGMVFKGAGSILAMCVRYDDKGELDVSFGEGGYTVIKPLPDEPQGSARLLSIVQQSNGNLIAVGAVGSSYGVVVNLDVSGRLNPSFNHGRPVYFKVGSGDTSFEAVDLQADGKIVVAGWAGPDADSADVNMLVVRYLEDGSADSSYGTNGYAQPDRRPSAAWGITVQKEDDKAIVSGQLVSDGVGSPQSCILWRLSS